MLRWSRGSVAVEYGLLLPVLLLFLFGLVDCGRLLWTYTTLYRATEAAARCAAVNATLCGTPTQIQTYAVTQAFGLNITTAAFTASSAACGVQVTASLAYVFVIPQLSALVPSTITLATTACYPV